MKVKIYSMLLLSLCFTAGCAKSVTENRSNTSTSSNTAQTDNGVNELNKDSDSNAEFKELKNTNTNNRQIFNMD